MIAVIRQKPKHFLARGIGIAVQWYRKPLFISELGLYQI